jgi:hypothetical protein
MREPEWVGLRIASTIAKTSPCTLMRLALIGDVEYRVTDDMRPLFSVACLREIAKNRPETARRARPHQEGGHHD